MNDIRQKSIQNALTLGYKIPESLPILEDITLLRAQNEVIKRLLVLEVIVAVAYGFSSIQALKWLSQESLTNSISENEQAFLHKEIEGHGLKYQVESIWALCWCLGLIPSLAFNSPCSNDLIKLLPDLKTLETSNGFKSKVKLRSIFEIVAELDLSYCLHWAQKQSYFEGKEPKSNWVEFSTIPTRRHALEWVCDTETNWDDISLDT